MKNQWMVILCCTLFSLAVPGETLKRITVSPENPHVLVLEDGTPFFWLGDTAWKLFQQASREEAELYLENRASQGFNVIQAVAIVDVNGLTRPNFYGDLPLIEKDPERPAVTEGSDPADEGQYDYWDHMDRIIRSAALKGLYVGLLPVWGEYVTPRYTPDNLIFHQPVQAYRYGHFIGNRYRSQSNILWILGGDRHPDEHPGGIAVWRAMAEGIADGVNGRDHFDGLADYTTTLMTHHSFLSSSNWFHDDAWIDMHAWGSYHADFYLPRAFTEAENDWHLANPKPTINMEPAYEDHPLNYIEGTGRFTDFDVRQAAYWSVFSGACGHTYGAHPVWQFFDTGKQPESPTFHTWKEALSFEGASQMRLLKDLLLSRPMTELIPDQSLIAAGQECCSGQIRVIRGRSHAFFYIPTGAPVTVRLGVISGRTVAAQWFDPRSGERTMIGQFENNGTRTFDPPGLSAALPWLQTGRGCDWVLVLDAAELQNPHDH